MKKVKFIYMHNKYEMKLTQQNLTINNLLNKFVSIINIEINQLYFICKGNYLSLNKHKRINELKNTNLIIFVFNLNIKIPKNDKELKHIICPECKKLTIINNNNDLYSFKNCIKKHKFNDFTINLFLQSQYIDELKIKCDKCKNNKYYYDKFYILSKDKNLCPLCAEIYKRIYNIIDYDYRFYICNKHNNKYISYCRNCNMNLCYKCENEHKKHKIRIFKEIKPNNKRIEEIKDEKIKLIKYKKELEILKQYINNIINELMKDLDKYLIIYNYIIDNSKNLYNYESINNTLNLNLNYIFKDINYILNENNMINKYKKIINIYENKRNEMTIIYNNKGNNYNLKIFAESFVKNNKENCYLIINNKKYDLCEYYPQNNNKKEEFIIITLIETKKIEKMNSMFYGCSSLTSLPDISNWNTINVTNMSEIFSKCSSLSSLPDISNWNTINVINMSDMFYECSSLLFLSDNLNRNTIKVQNMSRMFYGC